MGEAHDGATAAAAIREWRPDILLLGLNASSKVLREQLRQMQADGLVARRVMSPAHVGVRYRLTPYGRTLGRVFTMLWRWGTKHLGRRDAALGTIVRAPKASNP